MTTATPTTQAVDESFVAVGMSGGLLDAESVQFRVRLVQLINWGGYGGHHLMPASREGTAILGPTGMGKSTVLDAMAAVMMPNPPVFNRAARDDGGKKSERTVYSYARGKTDDVLDDNRRTTTSQYLRPLGSAFPCAAAITWANDLGEQITAARVIWVPADAATNTELTVHTRYMLVRDGFDLTRLNEALANTATDGRSPIDAPALKRLVRPSRDLVTSSQPEFAQEMCRALGIGRTDAGSRRALELLRNAQASKGIFSINALFKDFVLDEPLALSRWETALTAYREASELYDVFESARKRLEVLKDVPVLAERYRSAMREAVAKGGLLREPAVGVPSPLQFWHAEHIVAWADHEVEDNRLRHGEVTQIRTTQLEHADAAKESEDELNGRYYSSGGEESQLLHNRKDSAKNFLTACHQRWEAFTARCAAVGMPSPANESEFMTLMQLVEQEQRSLPELKKRQTEQFVDLAGDKTAKRRNREQLERDLTSYRTRRSNVPPDADALRHRVAAGSGVDPARLPFAGELMEVSSEQRQWSVAVDRVLGPLAGNIVVDAADWDVVTRFVNDNNMRGRVDLIPAGPSGQATCVPLSKSVPAMVNLAPDSPYRHWLQAHLVAHYSYLCVEGSDQLREPRPSGFTGAVTRAGMKTGGHGRVIKDDRRQSTWLGFDNAARIGSLEMELAASDEAISGLEARLKAVDRAREDLDGRKHALERLTEESWVEIDVEAAQRKRDKILADIAKLRETKPDLERLRGELDAAREEHVVAAGLVATADTELKRLDAAWGELVSVCDCANDLVAAGPPLGVEDRATLDVLGFQAPADPTAVAPSLTACKEKLHGLITDHERVVEVSEVTLVGIFGKYLLVDERAEIDDTIGSLTAVLAIHQELETDNLPTTKAAWLAKTREDMQHSLRSLLVQIDEDKRTIHTGLDPINHALESVEFRHGSTLQIDPREIGTPDLDEFKATILRYTRKSLGQADANLTEKTFVAMRRDLARLDEQSRSAESWRRRVFDAREHVEFRAIESREGEPTIVHNGVSGKSGGEGQELIAFILGAALRYQLGDGTHRVPRFAPIVLDEGFVKADSEYTGRALEALKTLGFQLIIGAPRDKSSAFEDHVGSIAYVNKDLTKAGHVRFYPFDLADEVEAQLQ